MSGRVWRRSVTGALAMLVGLGVLSSSGGIAAAAASAKPPVGWRWAWIDDGSKRLYVAGGPVKLVTPDGTRYQLQVVAAKDVDPKDPGAVEVIVVLRRTLHSDLTDASQQHEYHFLLDPDTLHYSSDLTSVSFDTGTQLGAFGRIALDFDLTTPLSATCNGRNASGVGTEQGEMTFTPQGDNGFFGTIQRAQFPAVVNLRRACFHSVVFCPPAALSLQEGGFWASRNGAGDSATQHVEIDRGIKGYPAPVLLYRIIDVTAPASTVELEGESTVHWTTVPKTFLRGRATFTSSGFPFSQPFCGGTITFYDGELRGDPGHKLQASFDTGERKGLRPADGASLQLFTP